MNVDNCRELEYSGLGQLKGTSEYVYFKRKYVKTLHFHEY